MRITRRGLLELSVAGFAAAVPAALLVALDDREAAPNFKARSLDGERFSNESVRGKVTLVQFWTTWCPYCRRDQPAVESVFKEFEPRGLIVLAVNVGEAKRKVKQYLAENPRSVSVVLLEDTNLGAMFAAKSYPYYVAFDRNVKVAGKQKGAGGEESLLRLLRKAGLDS
jgi:thiol-disulfide isomerase/thioredoxin